MERIHESELILTPSGAVYHLNLRPEDLANFVITVGDPDRVREVSKHFDKIDFTTQHREFVTHTGWLGKKRLTVLSSGIGPDNIDIVMNELDACVNIDFATRLPREHHTRLSIIRFGTSGSLQEDIPVDSLVASSHGIGLDNLLHYYLLENTPLETEIQHAFVRHNHLGSTAIVPYVVEGSARLLDHFSEGYHRGITVTCPGFYAPQGRVVRAGLKFPLLVEQLSGFRYREHRITNFEMETSAIFGLGRVLGHDCLALNTIVANRVQKQFSKQPAQSIERMIRQNLDIIAQMPD